MERLTSNTIAKEDFGFCVDGRHCQTGCYQVTADGKRCLMPDIYERLAAYEDTNLTPERAAEFAAAYADGRLVLLPCIANQELYAVNVSARTPFVYAFTTPDEEWCFAERSKIGKSIFITRAEAEAALERLKEGMKDG